MNYEILLRFNSIHHVVKQLHGEEKQAMLEKLLHVGIVQRADKLLENWEKFDSPENSLKNQQNVMAWYIHH
jgi:hypothetical protein